jgi:hypothetical protein
MSFFYLDPFSGNSSFGRVFNPNCLDDRHFLGFSQWTDNLLGEYLTDAGNLS